MLSYLACPDPFYKGSRARPLRAALARCGLNLEVGAPDLRPWVDHPGNTIVVPSGLMFPELHWVVAQGADMLDFGLATTPPPGGVVIPFQRRS